MVVLCANVFYQCGANEPPYSGTSDKTDRASGYCCKEHGKQARGCGRDRPNGYPRRKGNLR